MSRTYGIMVGCRDALEWLTSLPVPKEEAETKERVLNRMRYEFDKDKPVEPRFHKGINGRKYDSYSCGNCGAVIVTVYKWCPSCGFRITDNYLGGRKTKEEQGDNY